MKKTMARRDVLICGGAAAIATVPINANAEAGDENLCSLCNDFLRTYTQFEHEAERLNQLEVEYRCRVVSATPEALHRSIGYTRPKHGDVWSESELIEIRDNAVTISWRRDLDGLGKVPDARARRQAARLLTVLRTYRRENESLAVTLGLNEQQKRFDELHETLESMVEYVFANRVRTFRGLAPMARIVQATNAHIERSLAAGAMVWRLSTNVRDQAIECLVDGLVGMPHVPEILSESTDTLAAGWRVNQ